MIHRDGRVLVTDFGLVRGDETAETPDAPAPTGELRAELTRFGSVMGTPGYMPPEQFSGRETDARSDQFSFS
jgi:serine/threonine protein kinase